jgi:hypothetical protein
MPRTMRPPQLATSSFEMAPACFRAFRLWPMGQHLRRLSPMRTVTCSQAKPRILIEFADIEGASGIANSCKENTGCRRRLPDMWPQ